MKAIQHTNNDLNAVLDPNDSVGIIDSYFPNAHFFTEFERFDRHVDKQRRKNEKIDYVSICSPNYLHDAHIRFALRSHAHAICEKPMVLNPWNIDRLAEIEKETGHKIFNVLQLRLHPSICALRENVRSAPKDEKFDIDLTYLTSRGLWYAVSWKGETQKSGGIATNIGVHFFDMLWWVFGDLKDSRVHIHAEDVAAGFLEYERARVRWFLSINANYLPSAAIDAGKRTYRSILIDNQELEFSEGFTELHTETYRDILGGGGYGLDETRASIETVYGIRTSQPAGLVGDYHPLCRNVVDG